jgi:hypothetical protein
MFCLCLAFGAVLASASPSSLGPDASKVWQLAQAGVEDSVIVTFVQSQTPPLTVSSADLAQLKAAGVSPAVLAALGAPRPPSTVTPVREDQLYRLLYGRLFHQGRAADLSLGLPLAWKQELEADPRALPSIRSYVDGHDTAQVLGWGGFGFLIGGLIYAGVSQAVAPQSEPLSNAIGFSAVGVGILSMISSTFVAGAAYQNLYSGLYTFNQDLEMSGTGGHI